MANVVLNLGDLGGYEKLDVYLKEDGALVHRDISDERTEADGVSEIIFGVGMQVCAHLASVSSVPPTLTNRARVHNPSGTPLTKITS